MYPEQPTNAAVSERDLISPRAGDSSLDMTQALSPEEARTGRDQEGPKSGSIDFDQLQKAISSISKHPPHQIEFDRGSEHFCHVVFKSDALTEDQKFLNTRQMMSIENEDLQKEVDGEHRVRLDGTKSKRHHGKFTFGGESRFHYTDEIIRPREKTTAVRKFAHWHKELRDTLSESFTRAAILSIPLKVTLIMTAPIGPMGEADRWSGIVRHFGLNAVTKMKGLDVSFVVDLPYCEYASQGLFEKYAQELRNFKKQHPGRSHIAFESTEMLEVDMSVYMLPVYDAIRQANQRSNIESLQTFMRDHIPGAVNVGQTAGASSGNTGPHANHQASQQIISNELGRMLLGIWVPSNKKDASYEVRSYERKNTQKQLLESMKARGLPHDIFNTKLERAAALAADDKGGFRPGFEVATAPPVVDSAAPTTADSTAPTTANLPAPAEVNLAPPPVVDMTAPMTDDLPAPADVNLPAPAEADLPAPTVADSAENPDTMTGIHSTRLENDNQSSVESPVGTADFENDFLSNLPPEYKDMVAPAYEDMIPPAYENMVAPVYEDKVAPAYEDMAIPNYQDNSSFPPPNGYQSHGTLEANIPSQYFEEQSQMSFGDVNAASNQWQPSSMSTVPFGNNGNQEIIGEPTDGFPPVSQPTGTAAIYESAIPKPAGDHGDKRRFSNANHHSPNLETGRVLGVNQDRHVYPIVSPLNRSPIYHAGDKRSRDVESDDGSEDEFEDERPKKKQHLPSRFMLNPRTRMAHANIGGPRRNNSSGAATGPTRRELRQMREESYLQEVDQWDEVTPQSTYQRNIPSAERSEKSSDPLGRRVLHEERMQDNTLQDAVRGDRGSFGLDYQSSRPANDSQGDQPGYAQQAPSYLGSDLTGPASIPGYEQPMYPEYEPAPGYEPPPQFMSYEESDAAGIQGHLAEHQFRMSQAVSHQPGFEYEDEIL